ncbi:hypothetical protein D3C80_1206580 [compost metagenome]
MHQFRIEAAVTQAVFEFDALGFRADQAEPGELVALEDGGGQFQVELMVVGHDNAVAARWQVLHFIDRLLADNLDDAVGNLLGEFLLA